MTSTPETDVSVMRAQAPYFTGTPGQKAFWDLRCIMQYLRSMWVSSGGLLISTRREWKAAGSTNGGSGGSRCSDNGRSSGGANGSSNNNNNCNCRMTELSQ